MLSSAGKSVFKFLQKSFKPTINLTVNKSAPNVKTTLFEQHLNIMQTRNKSFRQCPVTGDIHNLDHNVSHPKLHPQENRNNINADKFKLKFKILEEIAIHLKEQKLGNNLVGFESSLNNSQTKIFLEVMNIIMNNLHLTRSEFFDIIRINADKNQHANLIRAIQTLESLDYKLEYTKENVTNVLKLIESGRDPFKKDINGKSFLQFLNKHGFMNEATILSEIIKNTKFKPELTNNKNYLPESPDLPSKHSSFASTFQKKNYSTKVNLSTHEKFLTIESYKSLIEDDKNKLNELAGKIRLDVLTYIFTKKGVINFDQSTLNAEKDFQKLKEEIEKKSKSYDLTTEEYFRLLTKEFSSYLALEKEFYKLSIQLKNSNQSDELSKKCSIMYTQMKKLENSFSNYKCLFEVFKKLDMLGLCITSKPITSVQIAINNIRLRNLEISARAQALVSLENKELQNPNR